MNKLCVLVRNILIIVVFPPGYQAPPESLLQAAGSPGARGRPISTAAVRASTASTRTSLCSMLAATTEVRGAFISRDGVCFPTTGWQHLFGHMNLRHPVCRIMPGLYHVNYYRQQLVDADSFPSKRTEVLNQAALSSTIKLIDIIVGPTIRVRFDLLAHIVVIGWCLCIYYNAINHLYVTQCTVYDCHHPGYLFLIRLVSFSSEHMQKTNSLQ